MQKGHQDLEKSITGCKATISCREGGGTRGLSQGQRSWKSNAAVTGRYWKAKLGLGLHLRLEVCAGLFSRYAMASSGQHLCSRLTFWRQPFSAAGLAITPHDICAFGTGLNRLRCHCDVPRPQVAAKGCAPGSGKSLSNIATPPATRLLPQPALLSSEQ